MKQKFFSRKILKASTRAQLNNFIADNIARWNVISEVKEFEGRYAVLMELKGERVE